VDQDLLGDHDFLGFGVAAGGSFDEFAVVEGRMVRLGRFGATALNLIRPAALVTVRRRL